MKRKEAEALIGKPVWVWTSMNGSYAGILEEILPTSPWRGKVRITGVLSPAVPYEIGRMEQRRGFRPGGIIEVGNSSIGHLRDYDATDRTYLEALRLQQEKFQMMRRNGPKIDWGWIDRSLEEIAKRIEEEQE